ncbi:MAG TPA: GAF domain-containing sensor histidine kinase [Chitinophagaceae bacterium]|nr:GAF domain-containing sensor histidine kinase [Chitinophagaceae bacterium]
MVQEAEIKVETERIKALKRYDILDTPPDGSFDRITKLAAKLLNVPISIVTLVDTDRIWFKSRYGIDVSQIGRDAGLCASAILSDEIYLVEDATKDPRTLANPLVAGSFGLQFYAAAPLKVKDGHNLGTLCIIDKQPRHLSDHEKQLLQDLADILIDELELRLAARTAVYQQNQVLNMAAHDLKNPLTTIPLWADLINEEANTKVISDMCDKINGAAKKMTNTINEWLKNAASEAKQIKLNVTKLNFANLIKRVVDTNQVLANKKNQKLHFAMEDRPEVFGDETKLTEVVDNLISNAIKYSEKDKNITIALKQQNNKAVLEITDEGPGLTEEDKNNLFQRFTRLSAKPTGGETSTGLGLSIVKVLVEAHQGTISAESEGKNKGSKFTIEIPVAE